MKRVAIVGAGIVGITLAHQLVAAGYTVDLFENGPETSYPHTPQYEAEVLYANQFSPPIEVFPPKLPADVKAMSQVGDYSQNIDDERIMCVGGQATRWFGITPRLQPENFQSKTLYGYGDDWPISYDVLEPYYCSAEAYLGISGSNDDNPFAPPRSKPYPLPPFELSYQDRVLAEKLKSVGLLVHTTPQARARHDYDGRPGCQNFGVCETCPIGARYSPNHHLAIALQTGRLNLHSNCLVRRIILENGRARGIIYHPDHGFAEVEHAADVVILAAGGLETARLLLLSKSAGIHRDGIGNASGQVGRNLGFHHVWWGSMTFKDPMMPGRAGPPTMLSHQFTKPPGPRNYGGMSVEMFDGYFQGFIDQVAKQARQNGDEVVEALRPTLYSRMLTLNAETRPGPDKYLELSDQQDRFGDPFIHLVYRLDDFDRETYAKAQSISQRFSQALHAESVEIAPINQFWTAHHHLGACRMGNSLNDSVVDSYGAVHETEGLYVSGGSTFVTVTPLQPTLTMVAMAMRTAEHVVEQLN
jgi:glucose dehydrogenase